MEKHKKSSARKIKQAINNSNNNPKMLSASIKTQKVLNSHTVCQTFFSIETCIPDTHTGFFSLLSE